MQGGSRVQSISLRNLNLLIKSLAEEMQTWYAEIDPGHEVFKEQKKEPSLHAELITSHLLAAYLKAGSGKMHLHPAKKYRHLFSKKRAQVVLTYQWRMGLGGNTGVLKMIEDSGIPLDTELWIDVWFIDQNSRNIGVELAISQEYYILCPVHLIASPRNEVDIEDTSHMCRRGWCLWELGLRAHSKKPSFVLGALKWKVNDLCVSHKLLGHITLNVRLLRVCLRRRKISISSKIWFCTT
jgi:hypothetical protein